MRTLTDTLVRFIKVHNDSIDDARWYEVLLAAYLQLDQEDATTLYYMLTNELEADLESSREQVFVNRVCGMLRLAPRKELEAFNVINRFKNYLGMDEDELADFLRNYDDEWYCEYRDGYDGGYMLILR